MKIFRSISEPIRTGLSWDERWGTLELSVLSSWERGRERRLESPELAASALSGHLIPLPWKGGVEKVIKGSKVGVFNYLAMWQGLRGDELSIDLDEDLTLTCSGTGVAVLFTNDFSKYSQSVA
ncbi:MAG: hypothetical protein Q7U84_00160 [Polynucleobacter sp.]|nr:hypothetical protein [Polynucleobacter sp.]